MKSLLVRFGGGLYVKNYTLDKSMSTPGKQEWT